MFQVAPEDALVLDGLLLVEFELDDFAEDEQPARTATVAETATQFRSHLDTIR